MSQGVGMKDGETRGGGAAHLFPVAGAQGEILHRGLTTKKNMIRGRRRKSCGAFLGGAFLVFLSRHMQHKIPLVSIWAKWSATCVQTGERGPPLVPVDICI